MRNRLSFIFVQFLLLPHRTTDIIISGNGFRHALEANDENSGAAITQLIPAPYCNITIDSSPKKHQVSWLNGRTRGTSTSPPGATKAENLCDLFSGQAGTSAKSSMRNRLSFIFVQFLLLPHRTTDIIISGNGFRHALEANDENSGAAITQLIPAPYCNITIDSSPKKHQVSWLNGRTRGTSTSPPGATKAENLCDLFSGQAGSSAKSSMRNRLSFIFVQFLLLPHRTTDIIISGNGFRHALEANDENSGAAMTQLIPAPSCNITIDSSPKKHQVSWLNGRTRGTSTSPPGATKAENLCDLFSGQAGSSAKSSMRNRLSFIFVQFLLLPHRTTDIIISGNGFRHALEANDENSGAAMTQLIPAPSCNITIDSSPKKRQVSWLNGRTRGTSTSPPGATKAENLCDLFSGQAGSSAKSSMRNRLSFIFVQFLLLPHRTTDIIISGNGFRHALEANDENSGAAMTQLIPAPSCNITIDSSPKKRQVSWLNGRTRGTSTSPPGATKAENLCDLFSGQAGSSAKSSMRNRLSFIFVQFLLLPHRTTDIIISGNGFRHALEANDENSGAAMTQLIPAPSCNITIDSSPKKRQVSWLNGRTRGTSTSPPGATKAENLCDLFSGQAGSSAKSSMRNRLSFIFVQFLLLPHRTTDIIISGNGFRHALEANDENSGAAMTQLIPAPSCNITIDSSPKKRQVSWLNGRTRGTSTSPPGATKAKNLCDLFSGQAGSSAKSSMRNRLSFIFVQFLLLPHRTTDIIISGNGFRHALEANDENSGAAMTQLIPAPSCNITIDSSPKKRQVSWLNGRTRGTSTSPPGATKAKNLCDLFSGQAGSSAKSSMRNRLSFIFVQFLLLPHRTTDIIISGNGFRHALEANDENSGAAMTQLIPAPSCNITIDSSPKKRQVSWLNGRTRGTSTSPPGATKAKNLCDLFSGQAGSSAKSSMRNRLSFIFVQFLLLPHGTTDIIISGNGFRHALEANDENSGAAMTQLIPAPSCNITIDSSPKKRQVSWLNGRTRGTSTSPPGATKAENLCDLFNGQAGSSAESSMRNRLSFIFVQDFQRLESLTCITHIN
ncbi:hypothetical protein ISCGN_011685 [Ixodes scapularis]